MGTGAWRILGEQRVAGFQATPDDVGGLPATAVAVAHLGAGEAAFGQIVLLRKPPPIGILLQGVDVPPVGQADLRVVADASVARGVDDEEVEGRRAAGPDLELGVLCRIDDAERQFRADAAGADAV